MKPWTLEFVAQLFMSGGFKAIADLHNKEMAKALRFDDAVITERNNEPGFTERTD